MIKKTKVTVQDRLIIPLENQQGEEPYFNITYIMGSQRETIYLSISFLIKRGEDMRFKKHSVIMQLH